MLNRSRIIDILIICALGCIVPGGCSLREHAPSGADNKAVQIIGRDVPTETMVQGKVRVKVTDEFADKLELELARKAEPNNDGLPHQWNEFVQSMGVIKVERTFPYAGKFESRTRKEGLHLWYDIYFDEATPITRAGNGLSDVEGIAFVEYIPQIRMSYEYQISYGSDIADTKTEDSRMYGSTGVPMAEAPVFNDPGLSNQWHYYNDGTFSESAVPGADINVLPVWKEGIVGRSDVIVVITDMGVDFSHEDLKDNMWNGVDDQGNLIYGYNFHDDTYVINPGDHATHIAGTIAAVNNNGIGVCGIAGGDSEKGVEGVKIMSCQIASPDGNVEFSDGQGGAAIKWAADHGTVISQNSWQYTQGFYNQMIESDREAFEYFIKYAGLDENGVQTGPMAGGVIFFAAGNAMSEMAYPQSYDKVIAVSSMKSDFTAFANNNYGPWVDLTAPGGDSYKQGGDAIYSTIPENEEGELYGYMHGTSMASPHAAGVAALIVSHFGGPGFTAQELKFRLFSTLRPLEQFSQRYDGLLGHGLVDAAGAILGSVSEGPDAVTDLMVEAYSNRLVYSFTVPAGDPKPATAYLLLSDSMIDDSNYQKSDFEMIDISGCGSGEKFEGEYLSSAFDMTYNVAVVTVDENGGISQVSNNVEVVIGANNAPSIEAVDGTELRISNRDRIVARFVIKDEDGHDMAVSFDNYPNHIYYEFDKGNDTLYLTINGKTANVGEYSLNLKATDPYGLYSSIGIDYEIYEKKDEPDEPEKPEEPIEPEPPADDPIKDTEDADFILYPNPVIDNVYIKSSVGEVEADVRLYSQTGVLLQEMEKMTLGTGAPVDMADYPAGTYSFEIICQGRIVIENVVKL